MKKGLCVLAGCAALFSPVAEAAELVRIPLGEAAEAFEALPLEKDLNLMRNILYSGIWQRYNAYMMKKERHEHGQ